MSSWKENEELSDNLGNETNAQTYLYLWITCHENHIHVFKLKITRLKMQWGTDNCSPLDWPFLTICPYYIINILTEIIHISPKLSTEMSPFLHCFCVVCDNKNRDGCFWKTWPGHTDLNCKFSHSLIVLTQTADLSIKIWDA